MNGLILTNGVLSLNGKAIDVYLMNAVSNAADLTVNFETNEVTTLGRTQVDIDRTAEVFQEIQAVGGLDDLPLPELTPRQFNWMIARYGYDDAIDAVLGALKSSNTEIFADVFADIRGASSYNFDRVLSVIGNPMVAPVIPDGVDTSEATLSERWTEAAQY